MVVESKKTPEFKYMPDPLAAGVFKRGKKVECDCCGKKTGVYYDGGVYCEEEVLYLCPYCIESGLAAEEFDAEFQQDTCNDKGVPVENREELMRRTPGYDSWQGSNWPAHCRDYCAFIAYVGWAELEALGIAATVENVSDMDIEHLRAHMENKGHLQGYLFRCLQCGKYCLQADCD